MKENVETKYVQRTEYLDKNGLDMLWAKVNENTRNQVEVEYNRAQAVEGDITNKLDNLKYIPYVSKNNMSSTELGDSVKYQLGATEFIISAQHGSNDARTEFNFGEVNFISISKDSAVSIDYKGVTAGLDNNIKLTNTGIRKYINRTTPAGSATEAFSTDGGVIDTTAFALKSELDSYVKKTDIPEVDTSDFVSKTATDSQIINSSLGILGGGIQIVDYTADEDPVSLKLASTGLKFNGSDRSTIELNASDVNSNKGSGIIIEAFNENPQIMLNNTSVSDTTFQNYLKITNEGISSLDNNANHVYATDGSIADLTQYAKKSESVDNTALTALEQKITANTAAISNKQDAGNYIPYELYNNESYGEFYKIPKNIAFQDDYSSNGYITMIEPIGIFVYRNRDKSKVQISSTSIRFDTENGGHMYFGKGLIQSSSDKFDLDFFQLDKNGIKLRYGTNDEVLTSAGSTIDITRYALKSELPTVLTKVSQLQNDSEFITKSVYDEKIAALEARIAALEAKHTETA